MSSRSWATSERGDWRTPRQLFDWLNREFRFEFDIAATEENALAPLFDGDIAGPWRGTVWCNPPYGRAIGLWVEKAYRSARAGATVVCLLPARTDTSWWHEYVMKSPDVRFLRGRLRFTHPDHRGQSRAPFASVVVVFRPGEL